MKRVPSNRDKSGKNAALNRRKKSVDEFEKMIKRGRRYGKRTPKVD